MLVSLVTLIFLLSNITYTFHTINLAGNPPAHPAMDIYSFGIVMQMLIEDDASEKRKAGKRKENFKKTIKGRLLYSGFEDGNTDKVTDLISRCTNEHPGMRPSIEEVVGILDSL